MIQEPFAFGTSWIHGLDPRIRIAAAAVFSALVALSGHFAALIAALALALILTLAARLSLRPLFNRLMPVVGFLALIWLVLPFTFEGQPLFQWQGYGYQITWTRPGVYLSAGITLKAVTILLIFMSLVSTMTIATLGHALRRLYLPGKLVQLLLLTYRYIFVIEQEYNRLSTAMKIRGFRSGTNLHSYKSYAYLIGMLFVQASVRAQRVQNAMLCRGFRGRFYSLVEYPASFRNWLFLFFTIAGMALVIVLETRIYE